MDTQSSYIKIRTLFEKGVYPDEAAKEEAKEGFDLDKEMRLVADRYDAENALNDAIASGDVEAARQAFIAFGRLMQTPSQRFRLSSRDMLREFQNSARTINTLFRKAAESSHVPVYYIHELTTEYDYDIESAENVEKVAEIIVQMMEGYCALVKERSLEKYSGLIRQAVFYIQRNLCGDISTAKIAGYINVTPNYLSNRFKAETGMTVTDYIRKCRMELAEDLLKDTALSVQDIALQVGINDAGYFAVQFKRQTGITPTEYRKALKENRPVS